MSLARGWARSLTKVLLVPSGKKLFILGVGNPVKRDDSVGLFMASELRRALGGSPSPGIRIPAPSVHPELAISKMHLGSDRLVVLDAVEAGRPAGSVIFANVADSRFGFFATHNVPIRMHPSVVADARSVFVLGVQPGDVGVGEGLSPVVRSAAEEVVGRMVAIVRGEAG